MPYNEPDDALMHSYEPETDLGELRDSKRDALIAGYETAESGEDSGLEDFAHWVLDNAYSDINEEAYQFSRLLIMHGESHQQVIDLRKELVDQYMGEL